MTDQKVCPACEQTLPQSEFRHRRSRCRPCYRAHTRDLVAKRQTAWCTDCGESVGRRGVRCVPCLRIANRAKSTGGSYLNVHGYVMLKGYYDHPNSQKSGHILEHIKVMGEMLGRPLLPGENVHHKNGVRHDNRPENLELWVVKQPKGQRAEDLVAWAREILARYGEGVGQ